MSNLSKLFQRLYKEYPGLLVITLTFILSYILILPLLPVSFFDDFAYIQTVENFAKTGNLKMSEWTGTSLVFPVLWGSLFVKIFGFSIPILIFSNLFLFYFGLLAFYITLRNLNIDEYKSMIFSLFLLSYPWIFQFSYTFMSDIFYVSLLCLTIFSFTNGYQKNSLINYFCSGLLIGLAYITRQIAISILLSAVVVLIYQSYTKNSIDLKKYASTLLPAFLVIGIYYLWISVTGLTFAQYTFFTVALRDEVFNYLLPTNLKNSAVSNRHYYEFLFQRVAGYSSSTLVFFIPFFLFFTIKARDIYDYVKIYYMYIITAITIIFIYVFTDSKNITKFILPPNTIIEHDKLFINWNFWWIILVIICIPIWILLISLSLKKFTDTFIRKRRSFLNRRSLILIISFLLLTAVLYLRLASVHSPTEVKFNYVPEDFVKTLSIYGQSIYTSLTPKILVFTFSEIWVLAVLYLLIISFIYLILTKYQISISKKINIIFLFINLTLLFNFLVTILFAYWYWEEYLIPFVPLLILSLAIVTQKRQIGVKRSLLLVAILLLLSIGITRNRIQIEGNKWLLATNLLSQGIEPARIDDPNWAWRPYWYFENNFQKEIKNIGGEKNKYKIERKKWTSIPKDLPTEVHYSFIEISPSENIDNVDHLVMVSKPFWIFQRDRFNLISKIQIGIVKTQD